MRNGLKGVMENN